MGLREVYAEVFPNEPVLPEYRKFTRKELTQINMFWTGWTFNKHRNLNYKPAEYWLEHVSYVVEQLIWHIRFLEKERRLLKAKIKANESLNKSGI